MPRVNDRLDRNDVYLKMQSSLEISSLVFLYKRCHWQVNEAATTVGSPGELLSKRCVNLLKTALRPDVWPNAELKLLWFDKLLMTVESHSPNFANICTALELLSFLLGILVSGGFFTVKEDLIDLSVVIFLIPAIRISLLSRISNATAFYLNSDWNSRLISWLGSFEVSFQKTYISTFQCSRIWYNCRERRWFYRVLSHYSVG